MKKRIASLFLAVIMLISLATSVAQGTVLCVLPFIHPFRWKCTPLTVICTPPLHKMHTVATFR